MVWPAIIAAGAALVGGAMTNSAAAARAKATQAFNAQQAQKQMDFQERMSNTSYQRAMVDMRKAGLNPILAYKQGGAGTPSGAAGAGVTPPVKDIIGGGVSAFVQARQMRASTKNLEADSQLKKANTAYRQAELQRFRGYGESVVGRQIHTGKQVVKTVRKEIRGPWKEFGRRRRKLWRSIKKGDPIRTHNRRGARGSFRRAQDN